METQDRLARGMKVVRLVGLGVILFVALVATPTDSTASASCPQYTMVEECVAEEHCLEYAGQPCPGPTGCHGHYACTYEAAVCPSLEVSIVCWFEVS
jgi:hypothetical protein